MISKVNRKRRRLIRKSRLKRKVMGTSERPRLSVFRSAKHVYAQVIDDIEGHTLASASSLESDLLNGDDSPKDLARKVGELVGQRAKDKKVTQVLFDRGGYKYHGRVSALADGARSAGLEF